MINASTSHSAALIVIHNVKNKFLSLCASNVFYLMAASCDKVNIRPQSFWLTFKNVHTVAPAAQTGKKKKTQKGSIHRVKHLRMTLKENRDSIHPDSFDVIYIHTHYIYLL